MTAATQPFTILSVNDEWLARTRYLKQEVLGSTCARLLYGPGTEPAELARLLAGIAQGLRTEITLTNYTKDGHELRNELTVSPLRLGAGLDVLW